MERFEKYQTQTHQVVYINYLQFFINQTSMKQFFFKVPDTLYTLGDEKIMYFYTHTYEYTETSNW